MTHFYDDPQFTYTQYWQTRAYEHQSEVLAIKSLLRGQRFKQAVDLGGGYGRLTPYIARYAQHTALVEPSLKQRQLAKKAGLSKRISIDAGTAQKTQFKKASCDLVLLVRVLHHLPQPEKAIAEISRILSGEGVAVIEFANSLNFKSRITAFINRKPILPTPMEKRSLTNIQKGSIPFVNHHPHYLKKLLRKHHLVVQETLSVSNFRHDLLKKILPLSVLLVLEGIAQKLLAGLYFGPSIFFLVRKVDKV